MLLGRKTPGPVAASSLSGRNECRCRVLQCAGMLVLAVFAGLEPSASGCTPPAAQETPRTSLSVKPHDIPAERAAGSPLAGLAAWSPEGAWKFPYAFSCVRRSVP